MHTCEYHPLRRQLRRTLRSFWFQTCAPLLRSGLIDEPLPAPEPPQFTPWHVRRNFGFVFGEQRLAALRRRFETDFLDALSPQDRAMVINVTIVPEVFVRWHESGFAGGIAGFSRLWADTHDFCRYPRPYDPWFIVSLDAKRASQRYRNRRGRWGDMQIFLSMKER
jgi:hypothetical protein